MHYISANWQHIRLTKSDPINLSESVIYGMPEAHTFSHPNPFAGKTKRLIGIAALVVSALMAALLLYWATKYRLKIQCRQRHADKTANPVWAFVDTPCRTYCH